MAYKHRSRRSVSKLARKSRYNFLATIIISGLLIFATINWILPTLINSLGLLRNSFFGTPKEQPSVITNPILAPPVISIPFEATNSSQIDIAGFATANSKVKIFVDEEEKGEVETFADGSFILKNVSLNLGTNSIFGKTIDEKNQESLPSKIIKIILDVEKPLLNINEPEDNKIIQGGDKKVKISGNTEAGVQVFINDGQIIVNKDGNFTSEQTVSDGDNIFNIKAVDKASNTTEVSRKVIYQP